MLFVKNILFAIIGFIILDLYFNGLTNILRLDGVFWVAAALLFFVLAFVISKATKLEGLKSFGYRIYPQWWKHLLTGFGIGFVCWGLMYGTRYLFGVYTFKGLIAPLDIVWVIIQGLIGYGLGSTINDAITRGYIFAHLKNKFPVWLMLLISTIIYALDDAWNEGFSIHNTLFSIILGLSLGYAFIKTKAIWFTTGIHFGLNMMYCLFSGVGGSGGIFITERSGIDSVSGLLSIIFPALMFVFIVFYFRRVKQKKSPSSHELLV